MERAERDSELLPVEYLRSTLSVGSAFSEKLDIRNRKGPKDFSIHSYEHAISRSRNSEAAVLRIAM